jgi:fucose permease
VNQEPRTARWSVTVVFFVHGAGFASWAARIPDVQQRLHLSPGVTLGLLLSGPALGGLAGSQIAGWLLTRFTGRTVTASSALALSAFLAAVAGARSVWVLFAVLTGLGMADGITGVAMNEQGVAVQDRYGRPVLNAMHGFRSVGGMIGALAAAAMFALGVPPSAQLVAVAVVLAGCVVVAVPGLLPARRRTEHSPRGTGSVIRPAVALIAFVAFLSSFLEDAPASWGGVYLRGLGASAALAATVYAVFSGGETAGRFLSDRVVARIGWVRSARTGAALCVPVLVVALLLGSPWAALAAFAVCGAAISTVFPAAFSAAGHLPGTRPAVAMAQVGFAGNLGWLAVSPAIGALAGAAGLTAGLALLPLTAAGIAMIASVLRPADRGLPNGAQPARSPVGHRRPRSAR